MTTRLAVTGPYHLGHSLGLLRLGGFDPCISLTDGSVALALRTAAGPAAVQALCRDTYLTVRLWGAGSEALVPLLPDLFGLRDPAETFRPPPGPVRTLRARFPGMRLPRCPTVTARLMQIALLQLVTWQEGMRAWRRLVLACGEPAPGLADLRLPPSPLALRRLSADRLIAIGLLPRQARTVREVARLSARIEAAAAAGAPALRRLLAAIPGVGPWTVDYLLGSARADPDAVLLGDYGLPHSVAWCLAGEPRGSDERMLELLEPYRGHRFRVIRLLWRADIRRPRRGPGLPTRRHAG